MAAGRSAPACLRDIPPVTPGKVKARHHSPLLSRGVEPAAFARRHSCMVCPGLPPRLPARRAPPRILFALLGLLTAWLLAGCGTLTNWAQVGPNLKPSIGSSLSVPLGK
jgi:hypothetical protein